MATKGDIYEITVEGQYYSFEAGRKGIKPYSITFKSDENGKKQGFLSVFRNALRPKDGQDTNLLRIMKHNYPDYKAFRTHQVVHTENLTTRKPVQELHLWNRTQIITYINKKGLPIDPELYPAVTDLRQAVRDYAENPSVFEKLQEKRRATKGPELLTMNALDELNPVPAGPLPPGSDTDYRPKPPVVETFEDEDPLDDDDMDPVRLPEFDDANELAALIGDI